MDVELLNCKGIHLCFAPRRTNLSIPIIVNTVLMDLQQLNLEIKVCVSWHLGISIVLAGMECATQASHHDEDLFQPSLFQR